MAPIGAESIPRLPCGDTRAQVRHSWCGAPCLAPATGALGSRPSRGRRLLDAALKVAAFCRAGRELQRTAVRGAGLFGLAETAQQLPAGRVPVLVTVKPQRVDDSERRRGPLGLRDRDG